MEGDPDMKQHGSAAKQQDEDVDEGTQPRYVPCIDAGNAAFDAELFHSDHTRLNPRPMCGRRSRFSTLGSTGVNTVDTLAYRTHRNGRGSPFGFPGKNFVGFLSSVSCPSRMDIMMSMRVSFVVSPDC